MRYIFCSTQEINFIFPSIHVLFYLLCKKNTLLPLKNKPVNSNAFYDNRRFGRALEHQKNVPDSPLVPLDCSRDLWHSEQYILTCQPTYESEISSYSSIFCLPVFKNYLVFSLSFGYCQNSKSHNTCLNTSNNRRRKINHSEMLNTILIDMELFKWNKFLIYLCYFVLYLAGHTGKDPSYIDPFSV